MNSFNNWALFSVGDQAGFSKLFAMPTVVFLQSNPRGYVFSSLTPGYQYAAPMG
jgi:hypothetical protein